MVMVRAVPDRSWICHVMVVPVGIATSPLLVSVIRSLAALIMASTAAIVGQPDAAKAGAADAVAMTGTLHASPVARVRRLTAAGASASVRVFDMLDLPLPLGMWPQARALGCSQGNNP